MNCPKTLAGDTKYRNAILWAIDYFSTDRLTAKERAAGIKELCNVLCGRPSRAADYVPNEWDDSAKLSALTPAQSGAEK